MTKYTVTVSEAELDVVRHALGRILEAKPIVERKSRNLGVFDPDTGDGALDNFMRASRAKRGAPKPERAKPAPKFPYGLKALDARGRASVAAFNEAAERAWKSLGYEVIVEVLDGDAGRAKPALDWRNVRVVK